MRIFDSHCHLDPQSYGGDEGVDAVVETAKLAGVTRMLTVGAGYGEGTAARAVEVARRHEGVWASVGVHPHDAKELDDAAAEALHALADDPSVVAWGEVGLDFYYDHSPRQIQRDALRRQLRIALDRALPVIIHDRDSEGEVMEILDQEGAFDGAGVLYHCYAGDLPQLDALIERGAVVSIPGVVTWKKSDVLKEVATRAPLESILVETDAPFLTPEPLRGRRNEPCHVALTVEMIARLRGMETAELAEATWINASRFFGLPL